MTISVSKRTLEKVEKIIKDLQRENPREPVTKKEVSNKLKKLHYKTIERAFIVLCRDKKVTQFGRGLYWLPEYLEKNIDYLKKALEFERGFWENVDNMRLAHIAKLGQELLDLEQYYKDMIERPKILKELREKGLWPPRMSKHTFNKMKETISMYGTQKKQEKPSEKKKGKCPHCGHIIQYGEVERLFGVECPNCERKIEINELESIIMSEQ